jgi:hypothetical protein
VSYDSAETRSSGRRSSTLLHPVYRGTTPSSQESTILLLSLPEHYSLKGRVLCGPVVRTAPGVLIYRPALDKGEGIQYLPSLSISMRFMKLWGSDLRSCVSPCWMPRSRPSNGFAPVLAESSRPSSSSGM